MSALSFKDESVYELDDGRHGSGENVERTETNREINNDQTWFDNPIRSIPGVT